MAKTMDLIRAESRFSSFFGYFPAVMERVRKLRLAGYRFTIENRNLWVAKPKKNLAKFDLAKLCELLGIPLQAISVDEILRRVPMERVMAMVGIERLTGDDIVEKYSECHGQSSCMCDTDEHPHSSEYTRLYAANPEVCSLMVGYQSFLTHPFRAIVWEDKRALKLDRLYGNCGKEDIAVAIAAHWSKQANLKLRTRHRNGTSFQAMDGKEIHARFILNWAPSKPLPYMDTLRYLHSYDSKSVTIGTRNIAGSSLLCSQTGESANGTDWSEYAEPENSCCCEHCGESLDETDAYYRDWYNGPYCESCDSDACAECHVCNEIVDSDDCERVRFHDEQYRVQVCSHCRENHCQELHDGQFALTNDCQELHDGTYALSDDCQELHDGTYALSDDCQELHDGQYALSEDCQELHDGGYALKFIPSAKKLELCFTSDNPGE